MNANWRDEYPFKSNFLTVDGGERIHYVDEGSGPTLLMVHGNPTWSFYWRHLISALKDRYRVVALDHIGCGLSDKPSAAEYPYRLIRRIADLQKLIETLDLTDMTMMVHDWGGAIGLGAAGELPERIAKLVIFNSGAFPGGRCPLRIRVCRAPLLGKLGVRGFNLFARAATKMTLVDRSLMTPAAKEGYLHPYGSWGDRVAVHEFVRDIPLSQTHPSYATIRRVDENLARLADRPIRLMWGMQDWCFTPWFLDEYIKRFPNAQVDRFDAAGHYVIEDAQKEILEKLEDFLPG